MLGYQHSGFSVDAGMCIEAHDRAALPPTPEPAASPKRSQAHYLWAVLIARIYEVFPLLCPKCGGQIRLIAFITHSADTRQILEHIGVDSEPPRIAPARRPPLWDDCDAQTDDGVHIEPNWATDCDGAAKPAPDYEIDQRVNW
jgi:hypothetical protein